MRSRYNLGTLFITLIVSIGCLTGAMILLIKNQYTDNAGFGFVVLLILFASILAGFFYSAPVISFDEKFITVWRLFQKRIFTWDQVTDVILTRQDSLTFLPFGGNEGMKLFFTDEKFLMILGAAYSNMDEIRKFVTDKLNDKIQFLNKSRQYDPNNMFIEKKYAGNPFIHLYTFLLAGIVIFFYCLIKVKVGKEEMLILPFAFILIMIIGFGTQMHYFEISNKKLVIRNHYFPWKRKEFNLDEIEEVTKESFHRHSDALRILTYDFQSKLYAAGSLRNKNWEELFNDLASMGIKTNMYNI